ncbi:glycosyltransferase family 2 protein [Tabrizicola soli]|uniref:Glycosyltransferase family 2 protein n=1 Tax=Tabrizicola soli TaxID=2185115 RepID=A0ABV7DZC6_9RHOB|nr:glycosyltransferase family 2 protein [Tabrizicola soli]
MDAPANSAALAGLAEVVGHPVAATRKVLFSAMKNEAPFLLEWVAYHKAIGFDEIVICSNPSNDGMEELLAALAEADEIRHLRTSVEAGQSPQTVASAAFTHEIGYRDGDWYMWLDADEFLNVHVGDRNLDALIEAMGAAQCFLINWRIFGSNGHATFPGRFLSPAFERASGLPFKGNLEVKSLFRKTASIAGFASVGIHRPLVNAEVGLDLAAVLTGSGKPGSTGRRQLLWSRGAPLGRTNAVTPREAGWALAQINHYVVRTPEFFALKKQRGRGYKADAVGPANDRHNGVFFREHDRNEEEDRSILYWQDAVTLEIERLLARPAVARAKATSDGLVQKLLAALPRESAEMPAQAEPASAEVAAPAFELTFPDLEAAFVTKAYAGARNVLEYGSGGSTMLAARGGAQVVSVESDPDWAGRLAEALAGISDRARVHHVDIGPTKEWGYPRTATQHARFPRYALSVWDRPDLGEPDLVLIDGRFRAACLAAVRLRARRPTTVLFDDYVDRKYYHAVEKLARKDEVVGRMARFTVTPGPIPPEMLTQVIGWFQDPR